MIKIAPFLIIFSMVFLSGFSSFAQNQTKQHFYTKLQSNTKVGYLAYTPPGYYNNSNDYPVIIFLHGIGERGSNLDLVSRNGPPRAIKRGLWPKDYPFIVISPQSPYSFPRHWDPDLVNEVINKVKNKYRIDAQRIYVTGFSMGGNGAWAFAAKYPDVPAAIVPMSGWGNTSTACKMKNLPIWAFHGQGDSRISVNKTREMVKAINACGGNAKGTYPWGVGHTQELWETAYKPNHSKYSPNIYDWMLTKRKSSQKVNSPNEAPHAKAGADKTITLPNNKITLWGSGWDKDGKIVSFQWSKVSGPSVTLKNASTSNLSLSNMVAGEYKFKLTVKDNDNAPASDWVKVTVNKAATSADYEDNNGLLYSYYEGYWSWAPNFSNLSAKKTGKVKNFNLWPKLRGNHFGFMFRGAIEIKKAGTYTFYTGSDDGSKLYINNKVVVNNDGLHGYRERSGKVYLSAGKHPIKVVYFERKGGETLTVKYAGPGIGKQKIPNSVLSADASRVSTQSSGQNGLSYAYYEGYWSWAPNFSNRSAKKTGKVSNFTLSPKLRGNHFGFMFQGDIEIKKAGTYTFYTGSDDGSKLFINNKVVVNNDGLHAYKERSGKIYLSAGKHPIKVVYFERKGGETLNVKYAGPGIGKQKIPGNVLFINGSKVTTASTANTRMATTAVDKPASKTIAYPNAFENELNVDFADTESRTVQMSIVDQTGRIYYSETKEILSVNGEVNIDLYGKGMSAGIYFLKLNYEEGESEVIRLLKK